MRKDSLQYRLIKPTFLVIVVIFIISIVITYKLQTNQMTDEMVRNSSEVAQQMDAVWDYIAENQEAIEYTSDGIYEYKDIHCAIAGVEIGKKISKDGDYIIRYVREKNARNARNNADRFELKALEAFELDTTLEEYWDYSSYLNEPVLRYLEPLRIEDSCLDCHGEPAGVLDKSGHLKDGLIIGDLIGAVSIITPKKKYVLNVLTNILSVGFIFLLLLFSSIFILYTIISKSFLRPIAELEKEVTYIDNGQFDVELDGLSEIYEIQSLGNHIQSMSKNLQNLYSNLENEVEIRTIQLEQMNIDLKQQQELLKDANQQLRDQYQYKSDFMAIMSHELRTPLSSIIAFNAILLKKDIIDKKEAKNILEEIKVNGVILLNLINNILDMARIEAGKDELKKTLVDWVDICGQVYNVIEPLAEQKIISFTKKVDSNVPLMMGDWEKLRRMVENIVSNAIKFTPDNGSVSLKVGYEEESKNIIVKVRDTGIGIEKKDVINIFDKFYQSDSSNKRQANGTGLGLALAKSIVEMHGGEILVESFLGQGSIFIVKLPVTIEMEDKLYESDASR